MKRTRAPNFSNDEIMNLLALVETYPVVENKKIDAASVKEKCEAWQNLCQEYNAKTPDCPRTAENLFACYKNLKNRAKRKLSTDNTVVKTKHLIDYVTEHNQDPKAPNVTQESINSKNTIMEFLQTRHGNNHKSDNDFTGEAPVLSLSDTVIVKLETSDPLYTETSGDTECMTDEQDSTPPEKQIYPMEYLQQVQMCDEPDTNNKGNKGCVKKININKKKELRLNSVKKGKRKRGTHSLQDERRELLKAKRRLVQLQIEHQLIETDHAKVNQDFVRKRHEMELNFLQQKYEIELELLRNKK